MKRLVFEPVFDSPIEVIWDKFSDVNNYSKYIKYCHKSVLVGPFKSGSHWYDWSTVVYLPLKIDHQIIKVVHQEEIVYKINLPFGEIWQRVNFTSLGSKTKLKLEIDINFRYNLLNQTIGRLVYYRNQKMMKETIKNYDASFKQNN